MSKNVMGLIFLLSFLAACATSPPPPPPPPVAPPVGCQSIHTPAMCDRGQPDHITLTPGAVSAAPPRFCAAAGDTVVFKVMGNPAKLSAGTAPGAQNASAIWLIGANGADPTEFSVTVPEGTAVGDYKYMVFFGNGSCLDPMIQVTN